VARGTIEAGFVKDDDGIIHVVPVAGRRLWRRFLAVPGAREGVSESWRVEDPFLANAT
jgi:hypothetical protein